MQQWQTQREAFEANGLSLCYHPFFILPKKYLLVQNREETMARIFLIENYENLRDAVSSYLKLDDHEVTEFNRTRGVIEALETRKPDLIILDVVPPYGDGFHLARQIRREHQLPILLLTENTYESNRMAGFEVGGDDYVVKPLSPTELTLRVEAILQRTRAEGQSEGLKRQWLYGEHVLKLDQSAHRATVNGKELILTAAEWKILNYLSSHPGVVVRRDRLMGDSLDYLMVKGSQRTIDTHIKNLRAKLGEHGWIETVRGFGYRFSGEGVVLGVQEEG